MYYMSSSEVPNLQVPDLECALSEARLVPPTTAASSILPPLGNKRAIMEPLAAALSTAQGVL